MVERRRAGQGPAQVKKSFEELDYCRTRLGELVLRRRTIPMLDDEEVHEIILNGEFLMSSLFHAVEVALADLGLGAVRAHPPFSVVVGGLGLGYTAAAALRNPDVGKLLVVDFLEPVIRWHRSGMVPLGRGLCSDPRTRFAEDDFFALASDPSVGFDRNSPGRKFHAVLLDIDHTPQHWLNPAHASFYGVEGLRTLRSHLHPGGVFAMWSDEDPDDSFLAVLREVFPAVEARIVSFPNPIRGGDSTGTVYVAAVADQ
jgi:spermidine synthase